MLGNNNLNENQRAETNAHDEAEYEAEEKQH